MVMDRDRPGGLHHPRFLMNGIQLHPSCVSVLSCFAEIDPLPVIVSQVSNERKRTR